MTSVAAVTYNRRGYDPDDENEAYVPTQGSGNVERFPRKPSRSAGEF